MIIKENAVCHFEYDGVEHSFIVDLVHVNYEEKYAMIRLTDEERDKLGLVQNYYECELMTERNVNYWRFRRLNFEFISDDF